MCWATSLVILISSPSRSTVIVTAVLISGMSPGGNSTSTTGPAIETTFPSLWPSSSLCCCSVSVTLIGRRSYSLLVRGRDVLHGLHLAEGVGGLMARLAQGFGAAHDLHDLGGDARLTQLVGVDGQVLDELLGVVGGRLHGPLACRLLGRGSFEHGCKDAGLDVAREQVLEDLGGLRLELVDGTRALVVG